MEDFAEYILNEDDLISKMEIIYFLAPKLKINFDKSTVFKTEIARMFLKYTNAKVDNNLVLTACLLCNCKKIDNQQKMEHMLERELNIYQNWVLMRDFAKYVRV